MEAGMRNGNSITRSLMTVTLILVILPSQFFSNRLKSQVLSAADPLSLYPNIETMGIALSGVNLPKMAEMMYRQTGETDWRPGHPLIRSSHGRLIGSLFGLSPATSYDIKVLNVSTEITSSVTTQPDELQFAPIA